MLDIDNINEFAESQLDNLFNNKAGSLKFFRSMAWDSFVERVGPKGIIQDQDLVIINNEKSIDWENTSLLKEVGEGPRLVFIDGEYCSELSDKRNEENLRVLPIKDAFTENESLSQLMLSGWNPDESISSEIPFLISSLANSGSVIHITDNMNIGDDIIVLNIISGSKSIHSKNFIWLRDGVNASVIESTISINKNDSRNYFQWEVSLGRGSKLRLESKVGENTKAAKYFDFKLSGLTSTHHLNLNNKSDDLWSHTNVDFVGDNAEYRNISGSDLSNGLKESYTLYSQLNTKDCELTQQHRSVSSGKSVFHWDSVVEIGTNGSGSKTKQYCKSLVLDKDSKCFGKPQLMIENQNVEAGHGFAKGGVDQNKMNYLTSRGIDKEVAKRILIDAHLNEIKKEMRLENKYD